MAVVPSHSPSGPRARISQSGRGRGPGAGRHAPAWVSSGVPGEVGRLGQAVGDEVHVPLQGRVALAAQVGEGHALRAGGVQLRPEVREVHTGEVQFGGVAVGAQREAAPLGPGAVGRVGIRNVAAQAPGTQVTGGLLRRLPQPLAHTLPARRREDQHAHLQEVRRDEQRGLELPAAQHLTATDEQLPRGLWSGAAPGVGGEQVRAAGAAAPGSAARRRCRRRQRCRGAGSSRPGGSRNGLDQLPDGA